MRPDEVKPWIMDQMRTRVSIRLEQWPDAETAVSFGEAYEEELEEDIIEFIISDILDLVD